MAEKGNPASPRTALRNVLGNLECGICFEIMEGPTTLFCGHNFCASCIERWYDVSPGAPSCATCRADIPGDLPGVSVSLKKIIEGVRPPPQPSQRAASAAAPSTPAPSPADALLASVAGNFAKSAAIRRSVMQRAEPSWRALLLLLRCLWQCTDPADAGACSAALAACARALFERDLQQGLTFASVLLAGSLVYWALYFLGGLSYLVIGSVLQCYLLVMVLKVEEGGPFVSGAGNSLLLSLFCCVGAASLLPLWDSLGAICVCALSAAAAVALAVLLYVAAGIDNLLLPREIIVAEINIGVLFFALLRLSFLVHISLNSPLAFYWPNALLCPALYAYTAWYMTSSPTSSSTLLLPDVYVKVAIAVLCALEFASAAGLVLSLIHI